MNNNLLLVGLAVVAAALGLLLLTPAETTVSETAGVVEAESVVQATASESDVTVPVTEVVSENPPMLRVYRTSCSTPCATSSVVRVPSTEGCSACAPRVHVTTVAERVMEARHHAEQLSIGCEGPSSPCGEPLCPVCEKRPGACAVCGRTAVTAPAPTVRLVGGCARPVTACAVPTCTHACVATCQMPCTHVCTERLGINRSLPSCVMACEMIQFHSTVRQPVCSSYRFEWAASRGSFINPASSDPLYCAPRSCAPGGEDVWVTLTVTDPMGARHTDQVRVRVRNR